MRRVEDVSFVVAYETLRYTRHAERLCAIDDTHALFSGILTPN